MSTISISPRKSAHTDYVGINEFLIDTYRIIDGEESHIAHAHILGKQEYERAMERMAAEAEPGDTLIIVARHTAKKALIPNETVNYDDFEEYATYTKK